MKRSYELDDRKWEKIKDYLPGKEGDVGVTAKDNRKFVEGILYRYRTGVPWRDLPKEYGDFRVIHTRYSRWSKKGIWEKVFEDLSQEKDDEYEMIDSTTVIRFSTSCLIFSASPLAAACT